MHPPIQDMEEYEQLLRRVRTDFEDGEQEDYYFEPLLSAGEELLEHCEFLSAKLSIKVCINFPLSSITSVLRLTFFFFS